VTDKGSHIAKEGVPVTSDVNSTDILEELIPAVPGLITEKVRSIGFEQVSRALVDELVARCDPPSVAGDTEVHLKVTFGPEKADYTVTIGNRTVAVAAGVPDTPWTRIEASVEGLAETLFGRANTTTTALWKHQALHVPESRTPPGEVRAILKIQEDADRANNALVTALSSHRPNLEQLAYRFGTDKWGTVHWYTPHYERHFGPMSDERVRVMEIGIGGFDDPDAGGASLRMWQQYFRRGIVYGLDLFEKRIPVPRIRTLQANQANADSLRNVAEKHGPFDVIVDDGSHLNEGIITSFTTLFPYLRDGGIYVVEDMETAYWPGWGGNTPDRAGTTTSMGFLKTLIDGINYREWDKENPSYLDANVVAAHFYHNMAFIVKGPNHECAAPPAIRTGPPDYWPDQDGD
jgi:MycE methyltransferase N-terminal